MNNVILRKIVVTSDYQPLVSASLIGSVCISCPPGNSGNVYFKGDDDTDVPWIPGEWHDFKHIDLSSIQVKGNPGDGVTVVGGTW